MNSFFQSQKPIPQVWLNRVFVSVIVLLALVAGYFYTQFENLKALRSLPVTAQGEKTTQNR